MFELGSLLKPQKRESRVSDPIERASHESLTGMSPPSLPFPPTALPDLLL